MSIEQGRSTLALLILDAIVFVWSERSVGGIAEQNKRLRSSPVYKDYYCLLPWRLDCTDAIEEVLPSR